MSAAHLAVLQGVGVRSRTTFTQPDWWSQAMPESVRRALAGVALWFVPVLAGAGEPLEDALAATFRLECGKASATGFLVTTGDAHEGRAPSLVLVTAAHAFEGTADAECRVIFRSQKPDDSYARQEAPIPLRRGDQPLWKRHPQLDVAALRVELPAGVAARPFRLEQIAAAEWVAERRLRVGADVYIPCFPARLEGNEVGWPILRKGAVATYPLAPVQSVRTILIDANTFGGDSGAPVVVVAGDEPRVIGLVLGMQRQTDRVSLPFEERTVHMPLGLAIVAQAAFIRETIAALAP